MVVLQLRDPVEHAVLDHSNGAVEQSNRRHTRQRISRPALIYRW
ncbi:MAG TPA: hypothetical protein VFR23_19015 [Jiangellaceae bacterium]|nr:hypothetical protein [Jiangellaceae bacterium]